MTILSLASLPQTSQWSVNSSKIDQSVTLFLGWRKVCLLQKSPQSVFSRLVPIRCCIITSWFAIVLSEIRTGQILREELDCKQSIATCISGCALFFSHYFLLMCLHFLYQEHNKDCCLFVCLFVLPQAFHCEAHDPLKGTLHTSPSECGACMKRYVHCKGWWHAPLQKAILQLWMKLRLRVTLFWYKPSCFIM